MIFETILAYGGFSGDVSKDMLKIYYYFIPYLIIFSAEVWMIYVISKKSMLFSFIALLTHFISVAVLAPMMGVKGEYGPHHIGDEITRQSLGVLTLIIFTFPLIHYLNRRFYKGKNLRVSSE